MSAREAQHEAYRALALSASVFERDPCASSAKALKRAALNYAIAKLLVMAELREPPELPTEFEPAIVVLRGCIEALQQ